MKSRIALALGPSRWESEIVTGLASNSRQLAVHRCVDVADLVSIATARDNSLIVVDAAFPRIDATIISRAIEAGAHVVGLAADSESAHQLQAFGLDEVIALEASQLDNVIDRLQTLCGRTRNVKKSEVTQVEAGAQSGGSIVTVWGTPGAPGRTHTAVTLAQLLASVGTSVLLIDADIESSGISETLCLEAEASGLVAACHHAEQGTLDPATLTRLARTISPGLRVITGIGLPGRRHELRAAPMSRVWEVAAQIAQVVIIDIGGCVDDGMLALDGDVGDFGVVGTGRSAQATALANADQLIAVASCEPASIARLLAALDPIRSIAMAAELSIVINRVRAPIVKGATAQAKLVEFVATHTGCRNVVTVRDDRGGTDAATARGLTLFEHSAKSVAITDLSPVHQHLAQSTADAGIAHVEVHTARARDSVRA